MIRLQELIFQKRPDVIIETGIAHGGSLIYSASLMKIMGINGRVIGVDIEIRPHNRQEIEKHFLFPYITLIEGNSASENVVKSIKSQIKNEDTVLIILDSNHSREHVLAELEAYCSLVTPGSYIIATDGIMQDVYDVPRGMAEWKLDNPITAVRDFLSNHQEFILEPPQGIFNESALDPNINTHWRNAWLKRA
jgi:cephalosporin hydroxylase